MNVLLDTHTFLWWVTDDPQLSRTARDIIRDPATHVFVSVVSGWEIAIKCGTGKLTLPEPPTAYVPSRLVANGFDTLPILMEHVLHIYTLPLHHRDPFDRLLIGQSLVEGFPLVTVDAAFTPYSVPTLW